MEEYMKLFQEIHTPEGESSIPYEEEILVENDENAYSILLACPCI